MSRYTDGEWVRDEQTVGYSPLSCGGGWTVLDSTETERVEQRIESLGPISEFRVWGNWIRTVSRLGQGLTRERPGGVPDTRLAMPTVLFFCLFKFFISQNELKMRCNDD